MLFLASITWTRSAYKLHGTVVSATPLHPYLEAML